MTKFVDSLGLKKLVTKIGEAVGNGTWLPVRKGDGEGSVAEGNGTTADGDYSHAEGNVTEAMGEASHAEGESTNSMGEASHAEGAGTRTMGEASHAEGQMSEADGDYSHAEGVNTVASGKASHAQGFFNYDDPFFIDTVGVGNDKHTKKNASVIYVKRNVDTGDPDPSDPKNGYQYLIGIGGYQGQDIAEGMKSVQEVIADLEKGVAASETMTVEEIREIMSA